MFVANVSLIRAEGYSLPRLVALPPQGKRRRKVGCFDQMRQFGAPSSLFDHLHGVVLSGNWSRAVIEINLRGIANFETYRHGNPT